MIGTEPETCEDLLSLREEPLQRMISASLRAGRNHCGSLDSGSRLLPPGRRPLDGEAL